MRKRWLLLLFMTLLLVSSSPGAVAFSNTALTITVYSDGYVAVAQALSVDPKASTVQVPLLSPAVTGLVATDQNGSPLSYGFSQGSANLTVYTLGATRVNLRYETDSLTSKNGTVWTFAFDSEFNSTVVLPQFSSVVSVSGPPYSINETNQTPEMRLSPGQWKVSYGVAIVVTTSGSTTTIGPMTSGTSNLPGGTPPVATWLLAGGVAVGLAAALLYTLWWRKRDAGDLGKGLRPDDVQVLNFIKEKGGRVLEPEIRMKFALPKTSAWRQIKRLERLGYVKVTKIGSQNQIELQKDRSPET